MRDTRFWIWITLGAAISSIALGLPGAAIAQEPAFGALQDYLPKSGVSGAWRYTTTPNSFEIDNAADPQAIQYFYVAPDEAAQGRRRIETTLSIDAKSGGSAGLLYGLNQQRTLYHMLTLDAQGTVRLFRRDGSGFRAMMETTSSAFMPGKPNQLVIQEKGDEISYFLNGTSLGSVGGNLYGVGAAGLGAVGDVRARFTRFSDNAGSGRAQLSPPSTGPQTASALAQNQAAKSVDAVEVKRIQIFDEAGPAGRMLAYETLVPKNWDTKGGIMWSQADGPSGCFTGARLVWGAGTKDEKYGVAFMDPMSWGVSNSGPVRFMCLQQDLTDAEAVMRAYFQAVSSVMQVQILDVQRPQEIQPVTQMIGQNWRQAWPNVGEMTSKTWADGVLIKARVKSSSGENDAYVMAFTTHVESRYGQTMFRNGRTAMVVSLFTPVGKLDEGHPGFAPIINNLRVNPQWRQVEAQWWSQKLRQPRPGRTASTTSAGSSTSIGDMMFDSWKKREGMKDAGHAKSVNSIWEVQPWTTSSGSTVLLNQDYNHAWELDNGSIVLTNNANFNPMESFNQTGQMMQQGN